MIGDDLERQDPGERVATVLLTNRMLSSPTLPPVFEDAFTCVATAPR